MILNEPALLVVGIITAGLGLTVGRFDWSTPSTRPMAAFLLLLGINMCLNSESENRLWQLLVVSLQTLTFIVGIEWANRIGAGATGKRRKAANYLFRSAQLLMLAYFIVAIIYGLFINTNNTNSRSIIQTTGLEFALFAPIIGVVMLLTIIAGFLLASTKLDRAELLRLRALGLAAPFLISGLILEKSIVPFVMCIGILMLCGGAIRYLLIQGQRGQFMSKFLAPEVAELVRRQGLQHVMRRERRELSVVFCDLRGFTNYARENDSNEVITLLEHFYAAVGTAAANYGGTIKDHAGDGVLILVGAPIARQDHCEQALLLSLDLMRLGQKVLQDNNLVGQVGLGIGVATGQITVGTIRGAGQYEYVAVGNAVNLAARLCDRAADKQILADRRTAQTAGPISTVQGSSVQFIEQAAEPLKGFPDPIQICAVEASEPNTNEQQEAKALQLAASDSL